MNRFVPSPSISSRRCSSSDVPSVVVTRACVWPLVNSADTCLRRRTPNSRVERQHLAGVPPTPPPPLHQDHPAQLLMLDLFEQHFDCQFPIVRLIAKLGDDVVEELLPAGALFLLVCHTGQGPKPMPCEAADAFPQLLIRSRGLARRLRDSKRLSQLQQHINQCLDSLMTEVDRLGHPLLGHFF